MVKRIKYVEPLIVALGFLVATVLVILVGKNPLGIYKALVQAVTGLNLNNGKQNVRYIADTVTYCIPYVMCALSMAVPFRCAAFNIGAEGQYTVGLTAATCVAMMFPSVFVLQPLVAMLVAVLVGAIWGAIAGYLKARFLVSEIVSTIMLNYIALFLSRIVTRAIPGTNTYKTLDFPPSATLRLSFLTNLTRGSCINLGLVIMLLCVALYGFIFNKTTLGFSFKATGANKNASLVAGINTSASLVIAFAIAGAFSSLGGALVALGQFKYGRVLSGLDGYGFSGIAVALVGDNSAIGMLLAGLLFGVLQAMGPIMQSNGIPKEITFIIQGFLVVFISLKAILITLLNYRGGGKR